MNSELTNEQLSAEIARWLFGRTTAREIPSGDPGIITYAVDDFAGDNDAAMGLVVPEMRKRGYEFMSEDFADESKFQALFVKGSTRGRGQAPFGDEPRAICEAALAALDAEEARG
jgi:hypothetical protein